MRTGKPRRGAFDRKLSDRKVPCLHLETGQAPLFLKQTRPCREASKFGLPFRGSSARFGRMAEIVDFVNRGAATITPAIVEKVLRHLPQWKLEFTQIYEPLFPHLVDQLEFLADAVEDAAEGAYKHLPYNAFAQAVFALVYAHKKVGIIPDSVLSLGRADDSSVVRAVLIQNEKAFAIFAATQDVEWSRITSQP